MAHEVFISYAAEDRQVADKVCEALERGGIKCWIAPRDVPVGADYEEAIVDAIASSRLLVLVLSSHSNASPHVKREIQNACSGDSAKPVVPLRIDDIEYNKALRYYLGSAQWLDASTPPLEQHLDRLVEHVRSRLARSGDAARPVEPLTPTHPTNPPRDYDSFKGTGDGTPVMRGTGDGRKPFPLAIVAAGVGALVLIGIVVAVLAMRGGRDNGNTLPANNANVYYATPTPQRTATPSPTPTPSASPTPTPRQPVSNFNRPLNYNLRRPQNRNY
ncbi:MAG TPA: toll/interleukin-1 receptor domain-containing protein [Pyrinomonadaceae bacterium]|nr:toll/interleukin-1 receptor domain-containing protein [Pyrinomonadaceae bacterium]